MVFLFTQKSKKGVFNKKDNISNWPKLSINNHFIKKNTLNQPRTKRIFNFAKRRSGINPKI